MKTNTLIAAYNVAIDAKSTFADTLTKLSHESDKTVKEFVESVTWDIMNAVLRTGEAAYLGKTPRVEWNLLGDTFALVFPEAECWKEITGGMRAAYEAFNPGKTFTGGFVQQVEHAGKKTRAKSTKTDARAMGWDKIAKRISADLEALDKVKAPKNGKEYAEARAKVLILAQRFGIAPELIA